ncbi:Bacteriophage lambda integrase, N-terminal domain [Serratia proteamaculans]|uniref:phage integrase Arm DNA-binding domain-containing protein n=1 Tax=Serratia proteamaculans TaxID=28151 RepID=UPI00217A70B3|nr:phage integrase Arm DNA-binding domain-containing protein [Serratia proteamaculans]CAI1579907.1 Bacteriophage lambda integrase, N-terminal domain [Serratia proteamaculans]
MAARPRKFNLNVPNLYCKLDKRTNKVYWQYRHPITGKFIGFGTNEEHARDAATEANRLLSEQQSRQATLLVDIAISTTQKVQPSITLFKWVERYLEIQAERISDGTLKPTTLKTRKSCALTLAKKLPNIRLKQVDTKSLAMILDEYKDMGKSRMAQLLRSVWIDMFKEAQHSGEVDAGYNPALATRKPKAKVSRERLSLEVWQRIFAAAETMPPYVQNAMLLAVVTGQRREDISNMKFTDVWGGYLHIQQSKTGSKVALPLSLRCNSIEWTLEEVIARCRDRTVSPYLLHHVRAHATIKPGQSVDTSSLSRSFLEARQAAGVKPPKNGTAPSFHEQRSLAERLYSAQGVDTQTLLGHKTQEMTDKYHDDRGADWTTLVV